MEKRIEINFTLLTNALTKLAIVPCKSLEEIHKLVFNESKWSKENYFLHSNGKHVLNFQDIHNGNTVKVIPKLCGGKGGFGSMLRAIGAQIEKTTNREACRDLSGRRLRDINEEQRLKKWISQQAEREKEIELKKKKKLEKLSAEPKHEFKDDKYFTERSEMCEKLCDAIDQGVNNLKRKCDEGGGTTTVFFKQKKKKTLLDLDDEFSSNSSDGDDEEIKEKDATLNIKSKSLENLSTNMNQSDDSSSTSLEIERNVAQSSSKIID